MRWMFVCLLLAACSSDPDVLELGRTGAICPTVDPPTYTSFGQGFFTTYCLDCHTQQKVGEDRNGAPETIDFDTQSLVREHTSLIDKQAAIGPLRENRSMPLEGHLPVPTDDERVRLGEYIACEIAR